MAKKRVPKKKKQPPRKSVTRSEQNPASVDVQSLARVLPKKSKGKKGTRGR